MATTHHGVALVIPVHYSYSAMSAFEPFKLARVPGAPVTNEELLSDLQRVASASQLKTVPMKKYNQIGTYDYSTFIHRFGSWNKALLAAGLSLSNEIDIDDERLFQNLLTLWQHFGRQPRRSELAKPPSEISQSPYSRRFGSWTKALKAFIEFANDSKVDKNNVVSETISSAPTTGRDPSLRLRWKVLQRDSFRCRKCGASPATSEGVQLQVDHVIPWSKGGLTILDNLQTLCSVCNRGKSDE